MVPLGRRLEDDDVVVVADRDLPSRHARAAEVSVATAPRNQRHVLAPVKARADEDTDSMAEGPLCQTWRTRLSWRGGR